MDASANTTTCFYLHGCWYAQNDLNIHTVVNPLIFSRSIMSMCQNQSEELARFVTEALNVDLECSYIHSAVGKPENILAFMSQYKCVAYSVHIRLHSHSLEAEQILWLSSPSGRVFHPPTYHAYTHTFIPTLHVSVYSFPSSLLS